MSLQTDETTADTFWPGYVDAVTNLVLNLLFVVLIMTVAVFVLALEMGRKQMAIPSELASPPVATLNTDQNVNALGAKSKIDGTQSKEHASIQAKEEQIRKLEQKIQSMEDEIRRRSSTETKKIQEPIAPMSKGANLPSSTDANGGKSEQPTTVIAATSSSRIPERSLDKIAQTGNGGAVLIKFSDDAIALTRPETEELRKILVPIVASGGGRIEVVVPKGFSEAKRLAFYRAMAVRNQLIEMKLPAGSIDISVKEGSNGSDSSRVMVSPR